MRPGAWFGMQGWNPSPRLRLNNRNLRHLGTLSTKTQGVGAFSEPCRNPYREKVDPAKEKTALTQDPKALIQTGPGLPTWNWRAVNMKWNGPVARNQEIRLWLLSPAVNLVLAFVRVLLLALLVFLMLDLRQWKERGFAGAVAMVLCGMLYLPQAAAAAGNEAVFPPPDLLKQLENRLLEPPDCLPLCAQSPNMELQVTTETSAAAFPDPCRRRYGRPPAGKYQIMAAGKGPDECSARRRALAG